MDATLGLRLFTVRHPVASMDTRGAIAEFVDGTWRYYPERPDDHTDAFETYLYDHLADLSGSKPAPQSVYAEGDAAVVVVLDTQLFDVFEDGVEYRYRVDVPQAQAISSAKTDDETGVVAERTVPDDWLANGMQRSADALDHAIAWLAVISPRSLADVADAAADFFDEESGTGEPDRSVSPPPCPDSAPLLPDLQRRQHVRP